MSNVINKIRLSGTDYTLSATTSGGVTSGEVETMISAATSGYTARFAEDEEVTAAALNDLNERISGISGNNAVEVTQAEYDALVSGGTVDPTAFYIITDAQAGDLTQYWTSAQTNSAINAAVSGKQDTLSAGTGIDITDNVISATGGGGKAVSGGTNISVTTGETADTINCTLPCYKDSGDIWTIFGDSSSSSSNKSTGASNSVYIGFQNEIKNTNISVTRATRDNILIGFRNKLDSYCTSSYGVGFNAIIGKENTLSGKNDISESYVIGSHNVGNTSHVFICGWSNEARNSYETSFGQYNNSVSASTTFGDSGNTLFSVGNGTEENARHNAFEIRQNGDIYYFDGTNDVKLQDKFNSLDTTIGNINTILESI